MKNKFSTILLTLLSLVFPCGLQAQYVDYRNYKVDSLEQVLVTNPPTGNDLLRVYRDLMWGYREINGAKAMDYARKIISITEKEGPFMVLSDSYEALAIQYYRISQYDSAHFYYDKALAAIESMKNSLKYTEKIIDDCYSLLYGNIGNFYNIQGKYHEAVAYYTKALKLFEKYDWKQSQANAYYNISEMYLAMGNYEQAEINTLKLDALAHELNDSLFIVLAKREWVGLYLHHYKDYPQALENANIAYRYYFAHPEEGKSKADVLNLLADIYLTGYSDDHRAEEYATQALALADTFDSPREKAQSLTLLSDIRLKRSEWRKAEQLALQALEADSTKPANTLLLYENLAKAYAYLGNPQKATEYLDKSHALQASWSNRNYQSALTEMEVKYETEKKELEIERQQTLIQRRNSERIGLLAGIALTVVIIVLLWFLLRYRNKRNHALTEMNATKDKFFSIISHDLKNPAVAQRDALQMLVRNARSWDADMLTEYYGELLQSANGQVELLYNLLNWAQLQTSRMVYEPEAFDLVLRLRSDMSLIRKMADSKGVTLDTELPVQAYVTGDANMLSTVVRNLLTNAVKFTQAGGTVSLTIEAASDDRVTVVVSDTGSGMSEEQLRTLFRLDDQHSRPGTAGEQGTGLGLIVCKEMLDKHHSELHVESKMGEGSKLSFELKVKSENRMIKA